MNQLKEAEKKATLLVQDARKERVTKMKEAKSEAEKLIAAYKSELETNFQASLAKMNGSNGVAGNQLQASTNNDVSMMQNEYNSKKFAVQQMLVELVLRVNVKPPAVRE
jgi:V-type H+-transporting ATPase subunit G